MLLFCQFATEKKTNLAKTSLQDCCKFCNNWFVMMTNWRAVIGTGGFFDIGGNTCISKEQIWKG